MDIDAYMYKKLYNLIKFCSPQPVRILMNPWIQKAAIKLITDYLLQAWHYLRAIKALNVKLLWIPYYILLWLNNVSTFCALQIVLVDSRTRHIKKLQDNDMFEVGGRAFKWKLQKGNLFCKWNCTVKLHVIFY